MRRILLAAACVLFTCMPAFSQTLRIALRQDLDVMDPTTATTYVGRIVFAGLCDKLFDIDEKLNIVPQLATGYEWADDRTLVIHLRPGVKFHDGEVLDADAVKYSLRAPPDDAGQLPQERDQLDRSCGGGRSRHGADRAEAAVRRIPGAADRPVRHDPAAQGHRGGGQGLCLASGVQRSVQVRRARAAGPRDAGALPRLLERQEHPLRQGGLSDPGRIHPCGWPT